LLFLCLPHNGADERLPTTLDGPIHLAMQQIFDHCARAPLLILGFSLWSSGYPKPCRLHLTVHLHTCCLRMIGRVVCIGSQGLQFCLLKSQLSSVSRKLYLTHALWHRRITGHGLDYGNTDGRIEYQKYRMYENLSSIRFSRYLRL
jgi:hypothetical protein